MFGVYRRCEVPHSDGGGEDTLNGDSVERSVKFHGDGHLLEQSEEEHPLVSLLDDIRIDEFVFHFRSDLHHPHLIITSGPDPTNGHIL